MADALRALRLNLDYVQPWAIGVLAVALMTGGVLLAMRSMTVEDEAREHYEDALVLSRLALETQQESSALRDQQVTLARSLASSTTLSAAPDAAALKSAIAGLDAKVDRIGRFELSDEEQQRLNELKTALADLAAVTSRLVQGASSGTTGVEVARELAARSQQRFEVFENSLSALMEAVRSRTVNIGRNAEELNLLGRNTLMVFFVATLALGSLAAWVAARTERTNRALLDRVQQIAREDALTGAVNRRGLDDVLPIEFARAQRSGDPLTLVMIDLDHFKRFNDRRGHPAGDALLRGAAQAWLKQLRPTDMLARYGGEEFSLVLPSTDVVQAEHLVERLRSLVPERQTFSAGIAHWDGRETAKELLQRADAALLQAKKAGRNRTMIAGQEPQVTLPLMVA
jgi:diguanylate cyclase (GGDEF)-like protein